MKGKKTQHDRTSLGDELKVVIEDEATLEEYCKVSNENRIGVSMEPAAKVGLKESAHYPVWRSIYSFSLDFKYR